jgi:hypothetical protein
MPRAVYGTSAGEMSVGMGYAVTAAIAAATMKLRMVAAEVKEANTTGAAVGRSNMQPKRLATSWPHAWVSDRDSGHLRLGPGLRSQNAVACAQQPSVLGRHSSQSRSTLRARAAANAQRAHAVAYAARCAARCIAAGAVQADSDKHLTCVHGVVAASLGAAGARGGVARPLWWAARLERSALLWLQPSQGRVQLEVPASSTHAGKGQSFPALAANQCGSSAACRPCC